MSNDLISRQAALDALEWKWAGKAAIDAIKNLPSAQTKIVRCGECVHNCGRVDGYICCDKTQEISIWHSEDWFCADGEKDE